MLLFCILYSFSPRRILLELPILYVSFPPSVGYGGILVRMILRCPVRALESFFLLNSFEARFHYVVYDDLALKILLPWVPKCWE